MATTKFIKYKWIIDTKDIDKALAAQSKLIQTQTLQTKTGTKTINTYRAMGGQMAKVNVTSNKLIGTTEKLKFGFMGSGQTFSDITRKFMTWTIAGGVIYGMIGAITKLINALVEFDDTMARVSTVTRAGGQDIDNTMRTLSRNVLNYARTTRAKLNDIAKAMYFLGSAGLEVSEMQVGFEHIMKLTVATFGDIEQTGRLVAGMYNVFGENIRNATTASEKFQYISDLLTFTYTNQQVELSEIESAMRLVGSAAGILEIDLKTLIGTIGFLNTGMLKGTRAGTSLMNAFIQIAKKSGKLKTEFGLVFDPTIALNFNDIMEQLHARLGDQALSVDNLRRLMDVFGLRGGRAIASMIDGYNRWIDTVDVADREFKDFAESTAEKTETSLKGAFLRLGNVIKVDFIGALDEASSAAKKIINSIAEAWAKSEVVRKTARGFLDLMEKDSIDKLVDGLTAEHRMRKKNAGQLALYWKQVNESMAKLKAQGKLFTKQDDQQDQFNAKKENELDTELKITQALERKLRTARQAHDISLMSLDTIRGSEISQVRAQILLKNILADMGDLTEVQEKRLKALGIEKDFQVDISDGLDRQELKYLEITAGAEKTLKLEKGILTTIKLQNTELDVMADKYENVIKNAMIDITNSSFDLQRVLSNIANITLEEMYRQLLKNSTLWKSMGEATLKFGELPINELLATAGIAMGAGAIGGPTAGAGAGIGALAGVATAFGSIPGAIVGGIAGLIAGAIFGEGEPEEPAGAAAWKNIAPKIDSTNAQLQIVNRNLVAIRRDMRVVMMPESHAFAISNQRAYNPS